MKLNSLTNLKHVLMHIEKKHKIVEFFHKGEKYIVEYSHH